MHPTLYAPASSTDAGPPTPQQIADARHVLAGYTTLHAQNAYVVGYLKATLNQLTGHLHTPQAYADITAAQAMVTALDQITTETLARFTYTREEPPPATTGFQLPADVGGYPLGRWAQ